MAVFERLVLSSVAHVRVAGSRLAVTLLTFDSGMVRLPSLVARTSRVFEGEIRPGSHSMSFRFRPLRTTCTDGPTLDRACSPSITCQLSLSCTPRHDLIHSADSSAATELRDGREGHPRSADYGLRRRVLTSVLRDRSLPTFQRVKIPVRAFGVDPRLARYEQSSHPPCCRRHRVQRDGGGELPEHLVVVAERVDQRSMTRSRSSWLVTRPSIRRCCTAGRPRALFDNVDQRHDDAPVVRGRELTTTVPVLVALVSRTVDRSSMSE